MKCPNCGLELPDDSDFCQYCGNKLKREPPVPEERPAPKAVRVQPVPSARPHPVHSVPPKPSAPAGKQSVSRPAAEPEKIEQADKTVCADVPAAHHGKPGRWVLICLVLLLAASLAGNGIQYYYWSPHSYRVQELQETVDAQGEVITTQKKQLADCADKASFFDDLCSELAVGNIGRASNDFYASEDILVVSKGTKDRTFTLFTKGLNETTIDVAYSSNAAAIDFEQEEWYDSVTIKVQPKSIGLNTVTFSSSATNESFKVFILVTE